jgi:hypothetical protein
MASENDLARAADLGAHIRKEFERVRRFLLENLEEVVFE